MRTTAAHWVVCAAAREQRFTSGDSNRKPLNLFFCAEGGGKRPFGVALMLAGYDDNGPQLYQIDPSGAFFAWKASAIGKNMLNAKTFLEKRYAEDVEVEDAVHTALLTLKESFEGEMTGDNVEVLVFFFFLAFSCLFLY